MCIRDRRLPGVLRHPPARFVPAASHVPAPAVTSYTIEMNASVILATLVLVSLLLCAAMSFGHWYTFGMRQSSGYALVAPSDTMIASPPRSPSDSDSEDGAKRRRVELQPLSAARGFWNNTMNAALMHSAPKVTYDGSFTCLASGIHISNFQLDHAATVERLQKIVSGVIPRTSVLATPWSHVQMHTLEGVLRVLRLLDTCADGHVDLAMLTKVFYNYELPNTLVALQKGVLVALARSAPVMLVSTGATEASLGERLLHGERLIFHRPTELLPVLSLYKALAAHEGSVINRHLAALASLPLAELQAMAGSTEAKKVLIAAVGHLAGKRRLAKFHNISLGKIERAEANVSASLIQLGKVHDQVYTRLADERLRYQEQAAELEGAAEAARNEGKAARVIADLEHRAKVLCRWAAQRDPLGPDFGPIFKRRWREAAMQLEALKHLPRGHNPSIYIKYPNFKKAVQAITHDLSGRTDKGRTSATIYLGNSTWQTIADRLGDPVYMATLGGTVPTSVSTLKHHKYRSAYSQQRRCSDPSGQLNVSHSKVAKLLMPTAVEQPNGHMMNFSIKELERFGILNSFYCDVVNRWASIASPPLITAHHRLLSAQPLKSR